MSNPWNELLAELYANSELLKEFKQNPGALLRERGISTPEGVELKVLEDSSTVRHIVIPYLDPADGINLEKIETRTSKVILPQ
jgi:hypothetical protein